MACEHQTNMKYTEQNKTRYICKICGLELYPEETIEDHRDTNKHYEFIGQPYTVRKYVINSKT